MVSKAAIAHWLIFSPVANPSWGRPCLQQNIDALLFLRSAVYWPLKTHIGSQQFRTSQQFRDSWHRSLDCLEAPLINQPPIQINWRRSAIGNNTRLRRRIRPSLYMSWFSGFMLLQTDCWREIWHSRQRRWWKRRSMRRRILPCHAQQHQQKNILKNLTSVTL